MTFPPKGRGCSGERGEAALPGRARQRSGPPFSQSSLARAAGGYARQPKRNRAWAIFSTAFTPKGQGPLRGKGLLSRAAPPRGSGPPFFRFILAGAAGFMRVSPRGTVPGPFSPRLPRKGAGAAPGKGEGLLPQAGLARGAARPSLSLFWPGRRGVMRVSPRGTGPGPFSL